MNDKGRAEPLVPWAIVIANKDRSLDLVKMRAMLVCAIRSGKGRATMIGTSSSSYKLRLVLCRSPSLIHVACW